jgi:cytidine deaminase
MKKLEPTGLLREAAKAAAFAHAPYSGYHVGAALLAEDGTVFTGCNVENASYGLTNCAERTAIFSAVAAGHTSFSALAVVVTGEKIFYPCGACRQVLVEFCPPAMPVLVATTGNIEAFEETTVGELLPKSFKL